MPKKISIAIITNATRAMILTSDSQNSISPNIPTLVIFTYVMKRPKRTAHAWPLMPVKYSIIIPPAIHSAGI